MALLARLLTTALLALTVFGGPALAQSRIKDIVSIEGVRTNQLIGYGLVVGLNGTGDSLRNSSRGGRRTDTTSAAMNSTASRYRTGRPDLTRARICDEETPNGNPLRNSPRNGAGISAFDCPGRGIIRNSMSAASSFASRHFGNDAT